MSGIQRIQPAATRCKSLSTLIGQQRRKVYYNSKAIPGIVPQITSILHVPPFRYMSTADIDRHQQRNAPGAAMASYLYDSGEDESDGGYGKSESADAGKIRVKLRVKDILRGANDKSMTRISRTASLKEAIDHLVKGKLASSLVVSENDDQLIMGIFTARDVLRTIQSYYTGGSSSSSSSSSSSGSSNSHHLLHHLDSSSTHGAHALFQDLTVQDIMTPKELIVHCSPNDTSRRVREIMYQCKIRNLPVLEGNRVTGIVTGKLLADAHFNVLEHGGKKGFMANVSGRRGLPFGTRIQSGLSSSTSSSSSSSSSSPLTSQQHHRHHHHQDAAAVEVAELRLDMEVGSYALPHPFKREEGVAMNRRLYGADELSTDLRLCEDAHFVLKYYDDDDGDRLDGYDAVDKDRDSSSVGGGSRNGLHMYAESNSDGQAGGGDYGMEQLSAPSQIYLCVADGVGSWRQFGVDPRAYSHRLVDNARSVIESDVEHRRLIGQSPFDRDLDPIHPLDVIMDAWNMTANEGVVGSSTICVATLDKKLNQLSYSNIGDCGLMVIRHIDSSTAGYMRERQLPRHLRKTDLRTAYLSQQQLRAFNLPYQLGFSGDQPGTPDSFETPADADTASIPVMPGDIIILATDGLFDNLDLDEIVSEVDQWEKGIANKTAERNMAALAKQLVLRARELSLDKHRDSPFAILAKENDIMWGGGMPDDTSVVVARVTSLPTTTTTSSSSTTSSSTGSNTPTGSISSSSSNGAAATGIDS